MLLWCICVILESSSPTVFAEKSTHFLLLCFTEEIQVSKKTGFKEKSTSVQLKVESFRSSCRILWDWQCLASLGLAMEQKLMSCLVCSSSKKRKTGYVGALPTLSLSLNTHHLSAVRLHSSTRARDAETWPDRSTHQRAWFQISISNHTLASASCILEANLSLCVCVGER